MDLSNYQNVNRKRELSRSKEHEENLKRKKKKSFSCFGRCCIRSKQNITPAKILKVSSERTPLDNEFRNEELKQILPVALEKMSKILMTRSPLFIESEFCQKVFETDSDPCMNCTVQYGPDIWEDILKNLSKQLYKNNTVKGERIELGFSVPIEQLDTYFNKKNSDQDRENPTPSLFRNNVNSFINDIIGDGVDQISELIRTTSNYYNAQQQHPARFLERQYLKKTSQMDHPSSTELSPENASSTVIVDDYNWNLDSNEMKNVFLQKSSLHHQEPYNWEDQEYQWPLSSDLSQKNHLTNMSMNDQSQKKAIQEKETTSSDDDNVDVSYSVTSVVPSSKNQKAQSQINKSTNPNSTLNILNQENVVSTTEFTKRAPDYRDTSKHSHLVAYSSASKDLNHTGSNHRHNSILNSSEEKIFLPIRSSTHSSKLNHQEFHEENSSDIDANNNVSNTVIHRDESFVESIRNLNEQQRSMDNIDRPISSQLFHHQKIPQQNDRLSATSVSDLFKSINQTKKQSSFDLDSISTAYSIPVTIRPSMLPDVNADKHEYDHPMSSNIETKQSKSSISKDSSVPIKSTHNNLLNEHTVSNPTDNQREQVPDTFNRVHCIYDDIRNSWRHLLERWLNFMLPVTSNTDSNLNVSPSTIISDTCSWSTLMPSESQHMIQSDNIGPWWSRRDVYDRTPATFIFANEPLNTWYSIDMITSNKQMYTSIDSRPCYSQYSSCPNTYHCCCSSSSFS